MGQENLNLVHYHLLLLLLLLLLYWFLCWVQDYVKIYLMDFKEAWWEDREWAKEEPIKVWYGSRSIKRRIQEFLSLQYCKRGHFPTFSLCFQFLMTKFRNIELELVIYRE